MTAAFGWGIADFCARFASRRIGAWRTLMYMQPFGGLALTLYLWHSGAWSAFAAAGARPWVFAAIAGMLNAVSALALYHAFEIGSITVAAPVSSAYPALSVTLALASGERLDPLRAAGLAVVFAGVILAALSFAPRGPQSTAASAPSRVVRGAGWALVSAAGFGLMFWWLGFHVVREIGAAASVWAVRWTTFLLLLLASAPARREVRPPRGGIWWLIALVGLMDTLAFVANNEGLRLGHVSVVTVLSSLYGAVTVLLSAIFVRERMAATQWCGIALIFAGIVLVNL